MYNLNHTDLAEGLFIPKTGTTAKTGNAAGTETEADTRGQQAALDLEKKKMELEKELTTLQSALDKQKAEAERDMLRVTLERERMQATSTLEQVKLQGELFGKLLTRPAAQPPEGKTGSHANAGYVTELVGYHALKRVSGDITRGLSTVVGLGNDVRILIVDRLDYAKGDIPFIEITSQLSVLEVRCRKQVATNKELADLVMQKEEQGDDEKTTAVKSGGT